MPSGITADYSAEFFAHLDVDRGIEQDRGTEEVIADANTTIDQNGDDGCDHILSINVPHSDSSETSFHSIGLNKVKINSNFLVEYFVEIAGESIYLSKINVNTQKMKM